MMFLLLTPLQKERIIIYLDFSRFLPVLDLNFNSITYGLLRLQERTRMNHGKLVFSQLMASLPLCTFRLCVATHRGDHKGQEFTCMNQFLTMVFAQLTYHESLRNIEAHWF